MPPLPQTNVPLKGFDPSCECPPDDKLLFGPTATDTVSRMFTVPEGSIMFVEFYGIEAGTTISFTKHVKVCGAPYQRPATDLCGCCVEACADSPQALLTVPGSYRAVIEGEGDNVQDPTTIVGRVCDLPSNININLECGA